MKLDNLLNSLISLGREPRGEKEGYFENMYLCNGKTLGFECLRSEGKVALFKNINDLCSIDSGLRQFVCKEGLLIDSSLKIEFITKDGVRCTPTQIQCRIMLSSIETDKEKFLLENI